MDALEEQFWYLIPTKEDVEKIKHDDYYIKHGEKKKIRRKIYENVEYDEFEKQQIQEFKTYLNQQNADEQYLNQKDSTYLKMLQSGQFNHKKAQKNLEMHLQWKYNPDMHSLDESSRHFLQEGSVYLAGRDKLSRPVIIMDCGKLNMKKQTQESLIRAMSYFLNIVKKYMFVDGKIENWIFIIDVKEKGIWDLPFKALNIIIQTMQINFGGHLEKMFVLNPSSGLSTSWSIIQKMIDEEASQKISIEKKGKMEKLYEQIPKDLVQKSYGGNLPNIQQFWPPQMDLFVTNQQIKDHEQQLKNLKQQKEPKVLQVNESEVEKLREFNTPVKVELSNEKQENNYSQEKNPNSQLKNEQIQMQENKNEIKNDQKIEIKNEQKLEEKSPEQNSSNFKKNESLKDNASPQVQKSNFSTQKEKNSTEIAKQDQVISNKDNDSVQKPQQKQNEQQLPLNYFITVTKVEDNNIEYTNIVEYNLVKENLQQQQQEEEEVQIEQLKQQKKVKSAQCNDDDTQIECNQDKNVKKSVPLIDNNVVQSNGCCGGKSCEIF